MDAHALTQYSVGFLHDNGTAEWWDLYFVELAEARRWADHELELRGRAGWHAEISEGHWENGEFTIDRDVD